MQPFPGRKARSSFSWKQKERRRDSRKDSSAAVERRIVRELENLMIKVFPVTQKTRVPSKDGRAGGTEARGCLCVGGGRQSPDLGYTDDPKEPKNPASTSLKVVSL